ncbi:MAG: patatin-like phospholipase family protein [Ardenticatenaceae bacterium]|nr:patatin-like phospholipase family protein [Ardenticatenaceae bacterium]
MLKELDRMGVQPDLITGTSIGGLIGALAAAGLQHDDLAAFFQKVNLSQMYGLPGNAAGLSSANKFEKLLVDTIGRITFADLQIPLAVVATDLVNRKIVILDEGDVVTAVLATIAFPIIFPPVERGGMLLVDGGLLNNLPFDIARARGATFVIAVDLSNSAPYGAQADPVPAASGILERALALTQRQRIWQVLTTVTDIVTVQSLNARMAIAPPDVLLRPDMSTIGIFDFHRLDEGIVVGETAVQEMEEHQNQIGV